MPRQSFTHQLQGLAGWFDMRAVQYVASMATSVNYLDPNGDRVPWPGTVAHLNSTGAYELGAVGTQMPIYLQQWVNDYDVHGTNDIGTDPYGYVGVMRNGMSGLVAVGAYELSTTEYDKSGPTFAYNDPLHAPVVAQITGGASNSYLAGRLFNKKSWPGGAGSGTSIAMYSDHTCGIVSRPVGRHAQHKINTLAFWPVFFPGSTATT